MDKKELKSAKDDFALHVLLLQRDGKTKAQATFAAWLEGRDGLSRRLGEQSLLPLFEGEK